MFDKEEIGEWKQKDGKKVNRKMIKQDQLASYEVLCLKRECQ